MLIITWWLCWSFGLWELFDSGALLVASDPLLNFLVARYPLLNFLVARDPLLNFLSAREHILDAIEQIWGLRSICIEHRFYLNSNNFLLNWPTALGWISLYVTMSLSRGSCVCVYVCVPSRKRRFPVDWRHLVKEHIANIGIFGLLPIQWFVGIQFVFLGFLGLCKPGYCA